MSHYIADLGVFAHVMGASTDWGAETGNNHPNYESYVDGRTSNYNDDFNYYLSFDSNLSVISASDAAKGLAYDTTFDHGGSFTCLWMNNNYNVSNPIYWNRAGESLNLAVNYVADVLHTLYVASTPLVSPSASPAPSATPFPSSPTIPEFTYHTVAILVILATTVILVSLKRKVKQIESVLNRS